MANLAGNFTVASNSADSFTTSLDSDLMIYTDVNTQRIMIGNQRNALPALTFTSNITFFGSNNLGIGMSNPAYNLDVTGTIHATSNLYIGSNVGPGQSNNIDTTGNTGNIICSGNISAGNLGMFRNRVINGDMRINQRGAMSSNALGFSCLVDRFTIAVNAGVSTANTNINTSNVPLTSNDTPYSAGFLYSQRMTVTANASSANLGGGYILQYQGIEGNNISDFCWGTGSGVPVTLSFWMRTGLSNGSQVPIALASTYISTTSNASYITNVTTIGNNVWQKAIINVPAPPAGNMGIWNAGTSNAGIYIYLNSYGNRNDLSLAFTSTNGWNVNQVNFGLAFNTITSTPWFTAGAGSYVEFTGVQLEKGTIATPFEYRPLQIETQLCQRYYEWGGPFLGSANQNWCFQVPKRVAPTTTVNTAGSIFVTGTTGGVPSIWFTSLACCTLIMGSVAGIYPNGLYYSCEF